MPCCGWKRCNSSRSPIVTASSPFTEPPSGFRPMVSKPTRGYFLPCMKQLKQTNSQMNRFRTIGPRGRNVLVVVEFAPVQFAVSIRQTPDSISGWQCSSVTARSRLDSATRLLPCASHHQPLCSDEKQLAATHESAATTHSRIVAFHGAVARGAVVSGCVPQTSIDIARVATGGTRPREKVGKRRTLRRVVSRFTEAAIGSHPMARNVEVG